MVKKDYSRGYLDCPPDVTGTGIGKNYNGHRMFHSRKTNAIEVILFDGSTRLADWGEIERFRRDLTVAAKTNPKVARYLGEFKHLVAEGDKNEIHPFKPESEPRIDATTHQNGVHSSPNEGKKPVDEHEDSGLLIAESATTDGK